MRAEKGGHTGTLLRPPWQSPDIQEVARLTTHADRLTTEAESGKKSSGQYGSKTKPVGRGERVAEKYFGSVGRRAPPTGSSSLSGSSGSSDDESCSSSSWFTRGRWASSVSD